MLKGSSILVTGGTGSFGRRFVAQAIRQGASRIVVFSRDEFKQFEMQQELSHADSANVRYFIGDVRDVGRLEMAMNGIDHVVHAAALKQVPAAEYNPFECIHTNVLGAENVVRAAMRAGVKRVIALSTDKASSPINLYGASKLASDKIFVAANNVVGQHGPRFSVVRYGNVIGSRGSVVPFFRKLSSEGADSLPVTDERMTRFVISLDDGVEFVQKCLSVMCGGETFIPKIPSVRIVDLADAIAPGLPIKTIGIRPGEKLHEMMISSDDARCVRELDDSYVIIPESTYNERLVEVSKLGKPVSDGFEYKSDTNSQFLGVAQIKNLLTKLKL